MKNYDSISSIYEEGIPSRDHTGQGEEIADIAASGFLPIEAIGKGNIIQRFSYVYVGASGYRSVYEGEDKERRVYLEKYVV
jgi:hypothetical protein